ncbi:MAG: hypothetical protein PHW34_01375 [Hespellia sp.]|nr:hypothetical protein [Hespellia sp.]
MIAKNNEEKRSKLWNIVMTASTIIIVLIVVFFIVKIFTANPLEGTWIHDGGNLNITIRQGGKAEIQWPEKLSESEQKVTMDYVIDKKSKTLHLQLNSQELTAAEEALDGVMTASDIESALSSLDSTFDYSVDGVDLTLTDREYGDQLFFERQ